MEYGDRGSAVLYVQQRLKVTPQTGFLGTKTRAAVRTYEKKIGVKVDGVVDKQVWLALGVPYVKPATTSTTTSKGAKILAEAKKHKGKPYRYGAAGPDAF